MTVIGSGGAGRSTIARQLARQLGLLVVHLDECYWRPSWRSTDSASWETMQERLLAAGAWIIDGNYLSTLELRYCKRLSACQQTTTIRRLVTPAQVRRFVRQPAP